MTFRKKMLFKAFDSTYQLNCSFFYRSISMDTNGFHRSVLKPHNSTTTTTIKLTHAHAHTTKVYRPALSEYSGQRLAVGFTAASSTWLVGWWWCPTPPIQFPYMCVLLNTRVLFCRMFVKRARTRSVRSAELASIL